jgi:TonB-linked SusC/RagA family outer membrane protein
MKLVIVILITSLMQVSAAGFSQTVTLREQNASLESIISKIRSQTGYDFVYDFRLLENTKKVNVNLNKEALESALITVFKDQNLDFTIKDKIIVIKATELSFMDKLEARLKSVISFNEPVTGIVTDTLGNKLIGASVSLKGAKTYNTTVDNTGRFVFNSVAEGPYKLSITYVGFEKTELSISVHSGNEDMVFVMKPSTSDLDQVQVIAYGTTTKRFNVGSVATVTAAEIEKHPVSNVLLALQGQIPGLLVTTTSGAPGAAVNLQIRGQNTLHNGISINGARPYDQPLFIVDGVPMASQNNNINILEGFQNAGFPYTTGLSPFSTLNPADIESISVLKDADATSIYGSQGSNGVILITTKKGKAGKPQLSLSARTGVDLSSNPIKMMNTQQYREMRLEAFANDGIDINTLQGTNPFALNYAPDLIIFDQNKNTNWFDYLMGNTPTNTNLHGSFSGGTNTSNFIVSGGVNRQGYNFPGSLSNTAYTFHSGFNYNSPDGKLTVGVIADFGYQNNQASAAASLVRNILTPPNYPELIDAQGRLIWNYQGVSLDAYQTYGALKKVGRTQSSNMNNSMALSYEFIRGLKASLNIGYNRNNTSEIQQNPLSSQNPAYAFSSAVFGNNNFQTLNIEPQLNYKNKFGKGELTLLLGGTYKKNINDRMTIQGNNYANDALLGSVAGAATITILPDDGGIYKYTGAFGRIGYIWDQKYILSLTGRRDGSSNFGPGRKFGNFGAAGLGWIFSEEQPIKTLLPFLSFGKLSGSYGTSGTDAVGPYQYQTFWEADFDATFQGTRGYHPSNLYNPDYSWELKKTINTSLDLGFLNDRIMLNTTWYQSRTSNQLINATIPNQTGQASVTENSPATIQNRGLEFTLSTTNIKTNNFKWTTSFNISRNRNKLLKFPDLSTSSYAGTYEVGKPVTSFLVYRYKGVNPETGIFEFYTKSGEVTSGPALTDKELVGDLTPEFFGGLGNVIGYKNVSLSFMFQFSKGTTRNWLAALYSQSVVPGQMMNLPVEALARWQKAGDIAELQRFTTNSSALFNAPTRNFINSTGAYTESTYARLKMVSLSYSLPDRYLKRLSLKGLQFYVNAENLFVISNFKIGDPESVSSLFTQPLQRTIVGGLSLNL